MIKAFIKIGFDPNKSEADFKKLNDIFVPYIWGANGLIDLLKLNINEYCQKLDTLLVKYFVCPTENEIKNIKEIGSIDNKQKIIDVSIVVDDNNFFSKDENDRKNYLINSLIKVIYDLSKKIEIVNIEDLINEIRNLN